VAKTGYNGTFSVTVEDEDQLPEGVTQDDVWDSLCAALQTAARQWYADNAALVVSDPGDQIGA
jgi:hypothetical protein